MNHFLVVVCFLNIFVFSVNSAPTVVTTSNIFDVIQSYSVKNCPALTKNVLIDKNMSYLSRCRDVSLEKVPAAVAFDSMNAYLCVGILEADFRLCNALSNESYIDLAKSYEDLREAIEVVRNDSVDKVCAQMKNVTTSVNYSPEIVAKFSPWMSKFQEQLFGSGCSFLCADFGRKTNVFCSLLIYINTYIQNVQAAMQQRHLQPVPVLSSPNLPVKMAAAVENIKHNNTASASAPLENSKSLNPAPALPNVEQKIITTKAKTTTTTAATKIESTTTVKPHDPVTGDNKKDSQSESKTQAVVVADKNVQNAAVKVPAPAAPPAQPVVAKDHVDVNDEKPKESEKLESEKLEPTKVNEQSPSVLVQNSAAETENTAGDNKLETPKIKEEELPAADKNNAAIETTDKVDNEIFDTTVPVGLKDPKMDSYVDEDDDATFKLDDDAPLDKEQESVVPVISDQSITPSEYADVEDSNFFAYFMFISVMFIAGYVVYHNKQKILALVLEGRRDRNARRRPNTASYRKLNSNLEEAVTSKCSGTAAHVIY